MFSRRVALGTSDINLPTVARGVSNDDDVLLSTLRIRDLLISFLSPDLMNITKGG